MRSETASSGYGAHYPAFARTNVPLSARVVGGLPTTSDLPPLSDMVKALREEDWVTVQEACSRKASGDLM
ncbi:hypothetical protein AAFF_G00203200 [Aldrovandia affinis]|uniref:Uncharacterized protein n=1 Tax=Aldrovandia affinis TaxID=143900 RepID=A0AAD7WW12_9TELE|nr:hypothetical protein AAFF_G00203200 [Aldrovandia affinis]